MADSLVLIVLLLFIFVVLQTYRYLSHKFSLFKRLDIPGPSPHLIAGNLKSFYGKKPEHEVIFDWSKEYGKVYGYYEGGVPIIVVSDPDMVNKVLVKNYQNFPGRKLYPTQGDPNKAPRVHLTQASGPRWKRLRNFANATFTNLKLKEVEPMVQSCLDEMLRTLDKKFADGKKFDIYSVFQCLTMDVIGQTAFGIYSKCQENPSEPLLVKGQALFQMDYRGSLLSKLTYYFYEFPKFWSVLSGIISKLRPVKLNAYTELTQMAQFVVQETRKQMEVKGSNNGGRNFVQTLLHAEVDSTDVDTKALHDKEQSIEDHKIERKLTTDEISTLMLDILLAGFETTSTALGFASYLLAKHPEFQQQLIDEIDAYCEKQEQAGKNEDNWCAFDEVRKLDYLDWVVRETLRLYPLAELTVNRKCLRDCEINGLLIPKDVHVAVDIWSLHRSPDLWGPDPDQFRPERHSMPLSHPMAWLPFGAGPRFCVGMRFALMEMKMALISLLRKYKLKPTEQMEAPLRLRSLITIQPENGIWVILEKR